MNEFTLFENYHNGLVISKCTCREDMHAFSSIALTVYTYKMTRTVHSYEYVVPALPKEKKRLVEYKNNVLHQNYNI